MRTHAVLMIATSTLLLACSGSQSKPEPKAKAESAPVSAELVRVFTDHRKVPTGVACNLDVADGLLTVDEGGDGFAYQGRAYLFMDTADQAEPLAVRASGKPIAKITWKDGVCTSMPLSWSEGKGKVQGDLTGVEAWGCPRGTAHPVAADGTFTYKVEETVPCRIMVVREDEEGVGWTPGQLGVTDPELVFDAPDVVVGEELATRARFVSPMIAQAKKVIEERIERIESMEGRCKDPGCTQLEAAKTVLVPRVDHLQKLAEDSLIPKTGAAMVYKGFDN